MIKTLRILKERVFKAGYVLRTEEIESPWRNSDGSEAEPTVWTMAYTPDGNYIGNPKTARRLCVKRGIAPQLRTPESGVCSIGFSTKDGKWYGWSHRAVFGFKIGSTCKKGDSHYLPKTHKELASTCDYRKGTRCHFNEKVCKCHRLACPFPLGKGEWTAKTMADAKQMAIDFAESVS
jgi:hypothetical protein